MEGGGGGSLPAIVFTLSYLNELLTYSLSFSAVGLGALVVMLIDISALHGVGWGRGASSHYLHSLLPE